MLNFANERKVYMNALIKFFWQQCTDNFLSGIKRIWEFKHVHELHVKFLWFAPKKSQHWETDAFMFMLLLKWIRVYYPETSVIFYQLQGITTSAFTVACLHYIRINHSINKPRPGTEDSPFGKQPVILVSKPTRQTGKNCWHIKGTLNLTFVPTTSNKLRCIWLRGTKFCFAETTNQSDTLEWFSIRCSNLHLPHRHTRK